MNLSQALSRARRRPGVLAGPGRTGGRRPGPVGRPPRRGRCRLGRPAAATPLRSLVGDEPHGWRGSGGPRRWGPWSRARSPRAASGRPAGPSHSPARFALKRGRPLYDQHAPAAPLLAGPGAHAAPFKEAPSPSWIQILKATCSGAVHAPRPRRCGFGRPRHPVVGADHRRGSRPRWTRRVEGHPEAGAATSGTAPAHRVGDLRDRPPAPGPAPMVDPPVWWRISRAVIPPAHGSMIIESNPPRPPPAHGAAGRGVKRAGPHPGAPLVSKGPTWRVDGPGSWSRPRALAAGRCRRLSLLIAQVLGRLGPQAAPPEPPRGRAGSSPRAPVITGLSGVDLLEQTVQGPGLAQPPSHIAPVDGLVPLLSRPQSVSVLPSGLTQTIEHAPTRSSMTTGRTSGPAPGLRDAGRRRRRDRPERLLRPPQPAAQCQECAR